MISPRNAYCGELRKSDEGKKVSLRGWVSNRRNLGSLLFIDLRDASGYVQLVALDPEKIPDLRNEYVIAIEGKVRVKDKPNPNLPSGEIEVVIEELEVLNKAKLTPFIIADKTDALEDTRLQYRYLDLRRPTLQEKLRVRAKICSIWRDYFDSNRFLEIETPILNLSSPEGARDYLVPSRVHHGSFYALPQSPQLWKQLLMVGGLERYYQVAKCFRDEDLRADRQPEFTQLDAEMSFLNMDEILTLQEGFLARIFKEIKGIDLKLPLRRMPFWEALDRFGSDKPDTRYGLEIQDIKKESEGMDFASFKVSAFVKAIVVPGYAKDASRKVLDELGAEAKKMGLNALYSFKIEEGKSAGSFAKFINDEVYASLKAKLSLNEGDLVLLACHEDRRKIDFALGAIRTLLSKKLNLIKEGTYDLLWVVDFPMFYKDESRPGLYGAEHHPFTRPRDEDLKYLESDPEKVLAYAYDIVINGYEAGGGTLRIYDHDTQWKVFRLLGLSEEEVQERFGWFIDAFSYGAPPHGGIAYGLERLTMVLTNTDNIRDVIAFPKNLQASDPLSHAPSKVDPAQLEDLAIAVVEEEK